MAHTLLTPSVITMEALRILHQKLRFVGSINRQYDDRFGRDGAKIGSTLKVRMPNQFVVRTGRTVNVQDIEEESKDLVVATQKGVDWDFNSDDLALTIDRFSERYLEPAMARLSAAVEVDALSMYKDVPNEISDDGAAITFLDVLEGRRVLADNLAPDSMRTLLLNTRDNVDLINDLKAYFNPQGNISSQFREGLVANNFVGYDDVYEHTAIPRHATGTETANTWRTDIAASEADGSAGSIHIDTGSTSFEKGDIIEIEDVFDVHPESKETRTSLKRFVVTEDFAGSAEGDLSIYPSITATGAKQNVSAAAQDGKIIYKRESDGSTALAASAAYNISLGYHRDAFTFVTADLPVPKGMDMASRKTFEGVSLRFLRGFDIENDRFISRFDVLYGYKALRPEWAVRYGFN